MIFEPDRRHDIRHDLVGPVWDYAGTDWVGEVLLPWFRDHPDVPAGLRALGEPAMVDHPIEYEDQWVHYALSRLVDIVTHPRQPVPAGPDEGPPPLGPGAYTALVESLGGWWPTATEFHPFLHEIVSVIPAVDPAEPPTVVDQAWPGFFVGSLLLSRAGVTVRSGRSHLAAVAATSAMYWAWIRRARRAVDLSHGWGGNSQWRTSFRRDYLLDGTLHYNVEARWAASDRDRDDEDQDLLREVVRHRCCVLVEPESAGELWPWDTHLTEPAPHWLHAGPTPP